MCPHFAYIGSAAATSPVIVAPRGETPVTFAKRQLRNALRILGKYLGRSSGIHLAWAPKSSGDTVTDWLTTGLVLLAGAHRRYRSLGMAAATLPAFCINRLCCPRVSGILHSIASLCPTHSHHPNAPPARLCGRHLVVPEPCTFE